MLPLVQGQSSSDTLKEIRRVLWITMGLNLIVTVAKLVVGYWTGSLGLIAHGYDSVFDTASNVIGLIGVGIASQPADERHPYGHRKAETLASLVIAMLLFMTTGQLIASVIDRLRDRSLIAAEVTAWSFGALLLSMVVNVVVVSYELRVGRRLHSDVLVADAMHTRVDLLVSASVMVGLVAVRLGYELADPLVALLVASFIAKIGIDIIRQSTSTIMDEPTVPPDELEPIILSVPGVLSSHRVRTHGYQSASVADLHIRVDPSMSAEQAHAIAHEVERRLREHTPAVQDVTIHVEPSSTIPPGLAQPAVTNRLRRLATGLGLSIHSVWVYELDEARQLEAHVEVDEHLSLRDAHELSNLFEKRVHAEIADITEVTTHIEPRGELAGASPQVDSATGRDVERIVEREFGAGACHDVRVREGLTGKSISLHCFMEGGMTIAEAHRAADRLERELHASMENVRQVVVHVEPR